MEQNSLQPTKLTIGGERFQIQTDLSAEELHGIVAYVEAKMAEHLNQSSRTEPRKQLILMAMEIAAELFSVRQQNAKLDKERERNAERLQALLDLLSSVEDGAAVQKARPSGPDEAIETAQAFLS